MNRYKYDAAAFAIYRERLAEGYDRDTARGILAYYLKAATLEHAGKDAPGIATLAAKRKELGISPNAAQYDAIAKRAANGVWFHAAGCEPVGYPPPMRNETIEWSPGPKVDIAAWHQRVTRNRPWWWPF